MDILWFLEDDITNVPLTGSSNYTKIVIRRESDGFLYGWSGSFAALPAIAYAVYDEDNILLVPGLYKKTVATATWSDGVYHILSYFDNGTLAVNKIEEITLKGGKKVDTSAASINIPSPPAASLLVQEYYNNYDADGNGLIYGKDFYISTNRPKILDNLPKRGVPMSWDSYLAGL